MRKRKLKFLAGAALALALGLGAWIIPPAFAAHDPECTAGNPIAGCLYEPDGDTLDGGAPAGTENLNDKKFDDADTYYYEANPTLNVPASTGAFTKQYILDQPTTNTGFVNPDLSHHEPSNKDIEPLSAWACQRKPNVENQVDMLHGFFGAYSVDTDGVAGTPKELHLFGGADRDSNNGAKNIGIWLFQEDVNCQVGPAPGYAEGAFTGKRTDGDVFLVSEFTQGGRVSTIKMYLWIDPDLIKENGDEILGGYDPVTDEPVQGLAVAEGIDCTVSDVDVFPDLDDTTNHHFEDRLVPGANPNDPPREIGEFASLLCATVNETTSPNRAADSTKAGFIEPAWLNVPAIRDTNDSDTVAGELAPGMYFEFSLNIDGLRSQLELPPLCISSFMIETRTSPSLTSNLFDYMLGDVNTCGSITIVKDTDPEDGTVGFDFDTVNVTGSTLNESETLFDNGTDDSVTYGSLLPGQYTSTETETTGWDLTDITCTGDVTGGTASSGNTTTGVATFNLDTQENLTCTFTNTARATLIIEKQTIPNGATTSFTYTSAVADVNGASLTDDQTDTAADLLPGTYTVSEDALTGGWQLTDITCDDANSSGSVGTATATFNLEAGETVKCTFTNERATLELRKEVINACFGDAGDGGKFNLDVASFGNDPDANDVGDGGTTGNLHPLFGTYTISESAGTGTDLADYVSSLSGTGCGGPGIGTGSVTLDDGLDNFTCTFTNVRKAEVTVCKALSPATDSGTFDLFINGGNTVADEAGDGDCGSKLIAVAAGGNTAVTVSEDGGQDNGGTSLSNYQTFISCDNGSSGVGTSINFNVITGETVSCTITNVRKVAQSICTPQ